MHGGRQMSRPLNRKFAIALALIGLWILSCLGVFVLIHFNGIYFLALLATEWVILDAFWPLKLTKTSRGANFEP